jgi:hypothetical protein
VLAGFNPSDRKEIDARLSGGVLITKATAQGADKAIRPDRSILILGFFLLGFFL